jgi:hypothetical protein
MSAAYDLLDAVSRAERRYLLAAVDVHEAQLDAAAARIWRTIIQSKAA